MRVQEIAHQLGGVIEGDATREITSMSSLDEARPGDISFFTDSKYAKKLATTRASAVLVPTAWQGEASTTLIRVDNPNAAFAQVGAWFAPAPIVRTPGVHPTAILGTNVTLGKDVYVGPYTVIEDNTVIGDRCRIEAQVYIGHDVVIGEDSLIYPQVTIREGTRVGKRAIFHSGVRLGGDGYGFNPTITPDGAIKIEKIPQIGIVEIGDDVEIGCNTTIDRARFGRTRVGNSVKIDNLVRLGHNVQVGDYSGMAEKMKALAEMFLGGEQHVIAEFDAVFERVLAQKLLTEAGRALIAAKLGDAVKDSDPSVVKSAPTPAVGPASVKA